MFCPHCGGSMSAQVNFCSACGKDVRTAASIAVSRTPPSPVTVTVTVPAPGAAAPAVTTPAGVSAAPPPPASSGFKNPLADLPPMPLPTAQEFQNMQTIQWNWVLIGAAAMVVTTKIGLFILEQLARSNPDFVLRNLQMLAYLILGICFYAGGFFVGWKSPGVTIREAAISGALGVVAVALVWGGGLGDIGELVKNMAIGFAAALLGGWIGERYQVKESRMGRR